jgi:hypothetical protein
MLHGSFYTLLILAVLLLIVSKIFMCLSLSSSLQLARAVSSSDFIIITAWHPHIVQHTNDPRRCNCMSAGAIQTHTQTLMSRTSVEVLLWELQRLNCAGVTLSNKYPRHCTLIKLIFLYFVILIAKQRGFLSCRIIAWRREMRWWKKNGAPREQCARSNFTNVNQSGSFLPLCQRSLCQRNVSGHSRDN